MKSGDLFIGIFPTGISYADKTTEVAGDYKTVAFLDFATLTLSISAPKSRLIPEVREHAKSMQARSGERFEVSTCGQTVLLGSRL